MPEDVELCRVKDWSNEELQHVYGNLGSISFDLNPRVIPAVQTQPPLFLTEREQNQLAAVSLEYQLGLPPRADSLVSMTLELDNNENMSSNAN